MIEQVLDFLESIGIFGVYAVIFLEGSSLPFPGVAIVLAYGGLLNLNYTETAVVSAGMGVTYSAASMIPYYLGNKVENIKWERFQVGINKAGKLFNRYGIWSIALSRPFGIGNYISYLAGMSSVGIVKYLVLTFLGIYPWCYAILMLGNYFNGNYKAFISFYEQNSPYLYGGTAIIMLIILFFLYRKHKKKVDGT